MKSEKPLLHDGGPGGGGGAPRAASATLAPMADGETDAQAMLDPANQSLSEALSILLRLIYVGVLILFVVYLFSGLRRVQEFERGVRLVFGKVVDANLEPGLQYGPPFPFGEVVGVSTGVEKTIISRDFWVFTSTAQGDDPNAAIEQSLDTLPKTQSLKPDQGGSGSLITGDGSIVHAAWEGQYRRVDAGLYAANVLPEQERALVTAAAKRGIVRAVAEASVDSVLRQTAGGQDSLGARAREIAQATLDTAGAGIVIDSLAMTKVTPPLWVRDDFQNVQSAVSKAQAAKEAAETLASSALNRAAGDAAPYLIDRITAYEQAIGVQDRAGADAVLGEVNAAMSGARVDFGGRSRQASGEVTLLIEDARAYKSEVVAQGRSALARFQVMDEQFRQNPMLMLQREWGSAVNTFTSRRTVTQMFLPPGSERDVVQVLINMDPTLARDIEREVNQAQARAAQIEQLKRQSSEGLKTSTPLQEMSGE